MVSPALARRGTSGAYNRLLPETYDSQTLAAIKEAFGLYGWMDFINLANIKYRSAGKRSLISQVRYDARVDYDDDGNLAIVFLLPDGEAVSVTIPENYPGFDISSIQALIPAPVVPILDFTMPDNAVWLVVVML
jgi:hypothetical protein